MQISFLCKSLKCIHNGRSFYSRIRRLLIPSSHSGSFPWPIVQSTELLYSNQSSTSPPQQEPNSIVCGCTAMRNPPEGTGRKFAWFPNSFVSWPRSSSASFCVDIFLLRTSLELECSWKEKSRILSVIIMRSGTIRKIATNGTRIREYSQESGWEGNLKFGLKANL